MQLYITSPVCHAPKWIKLRDEGLPIISSWLNTHKIGEVRDWQGYWYDRIAEVTNSDFLIIYKEKNEIFQHSLIDLGAALAHYIPVLSVGCEDCVWRHHRIVTTCLTIKEALEKAEEYYENPSISC
jgi:hypothetical protein